MKISPVTGAAPMPINPNEGQSAGADRLARAKSVAAGQDPALDRGPASDPQVERAQASIKRIKMRTQRSPDRHNRVEDIAVQNEASPIAPAEPTSEVQSDKTESNEQTVVASEETKPLSPQFAALAKQKRETQLLQQKLDAEKKAFEDQKQGLLADYIPKADLKANALKVLLSEGVTYDQLTEQILAQNQDSEAMGKVSELEAKIKALEEGVDQKLTARDAQAEEAALTDMLYEAESLAKEGDDFQLIREANAYERVLRQIHSTYKQTGRVPDVATVMKSVEDKLLEESLKWSRLSKVQGRLSPPPAQSPKAVQQDRPGTKVMRTLTNRDGASSLSMSKRERAIAAMEGRLNK